MDEFELRKILNSVRDVYDVYVKNVENMYVNYCKYMDLSNEIDDCLGDVEDNVDDVFIYLFDFLDFDVV